MKTKLTLALVALLTGTAFGSMPAVLPEFKNEKQLAQWREEMAAKHAATSTSDVRSSALDVPSAFYTGKPYIESTGSYAFKYRSYNPELARWTSEDPSGFPDGANGSCYINNKPTSKYDYAGLESQDISIQFTWSSTLGFSNSAAWNGIYNWSQVENSETSTITDNGFSGSLPANGIILENNVGTTYSATPLDRSGYDTKFVNNVQWKRWNLDLQVQIWRTTNTANINRTLVATSPRLIKIGHWYE